MSGNPGHDPVGWPTFKDWPAPESLTHEGTYYKWMERAWRGGQRLFVNLLVENNKLCEIYPLKRNSCDDMDSIRLQARDMHKFQDYIDAQFGGPGKGFYRIVKTPFEARRVINEGKLAVIMGIETSVPFGCTFKQVLTTDVPACTAADITRQIGQMHKMGVRQMELVNKFDNALGGVAGDAGETGVIVNSANFLETGTFWDMKGCDPKDGVSADNPQIAFPEISAEQQDALFGAVGSLFGPALPAIPIYAPPAHCNDRGLTALGEHTIREMVKRDMIFDPDHLSVKARNTSLDLTEKLGYPGVLSSHSWSTPDAYPRFYEQGGFITPYAGSSTSFVEKWRTHVGWADPRYYWGIGFGADINGLGAQGAARGANVKNAVSYPFTRPRRRRASTSSTPASASSTSTRTASRSTASTPTGSRTSPKSRAPRRPPTARAIFDDMSRGAEAYLQMWERAEGIAPDSCRNPGLRKQVSSVKQLIRRGMTTEQVMRKVGQPFERLGTTYGVCAKAPGKPRVLMHIQFSRRAASPASRPRSPGHLMQLRRRGCWPLLGERARRHIRSLGANFHDGTIGFLNEMAALVRAHGKTPRAWADGTSGGAVTRLDRDVVCEWWTDINPLGDQTAQRTPQQLLDAGHRIMNCSFYPTNLAYRDPPFPAHPGLTDFYEGWQRPEVTCG